MKEKWKLWETWEEENERIGKGLGKDILKTILENHLRNLKLKITELYKMKKTNKEIQYYWRVEINKKSLSTLLKVKAPKPEGILSNPFSIIVLNLDAIKKEISERELIPPEIVYPG